MNPTDKLTEIRNYIINYYPQFIGPIESLLWKMHEKGDEVPNGKASMSLSFAGLFMYFGNINNDLSKHELDFYLSIKELFEDSEHLKSMPSKKLIKAYSDAYLNNKIYRELRIPIAISHLDFYDKLNGTDWGQRARPMFFRYANALVKADGKVTPLEIEALEELKSLLYPNNQDEEHELVEDPLLKNNNTIEISKPLDDLLEELNSLIGLEKIKREVQEMVNFLKVQKLRESKGMPNIPTSKHLVFYGNPGSGKTTVARLLAEIYKSLNILSKGHLVETDRAGLVAGYVGQTALKVQEVVENAQGGILFIDEAYALSGDGKDYGPEAIETLIKLMEDNRDDLVVIVAGYTGKMNHFLASNPGFKSRFNKYLLFDDYSPEELLNIFLKFSDDNGFSVTKDAQNKLLEIFSSLYENRDDTFGNARLARNIFESAVNNQANRIISINKITEDILSTIEVDDISDNFEIYSLGTN